MRLRQIYEDGRIVKGVNTTADVGPNEIKIQAAKFGNSVDKDGRPPTLSKKVKGAKTNVLFNLGLAESRNFAEALGEIANTTHIYVDMDGVLADFFTEWGKLMGKDNWRDIGLEQIPAALEKIRQTENFWLDLPLTKNAKNLLNLIKDVKGEYSICSSPLPGDPNSEPHKLEWIKKHLNFFPPKDVIITHDKTKYAVQKDGTPNILIDDYGKNINAWEAAGGVGFKHKDHKFERTAKDIKQHMQEPVEENITEALDNPYQYKLTGPNTDNTYFAKAQTPNGELVMEFDGGYDDFSIDFSVGNAMGKTDAGDQFRVFATVVAMMNKWISVVGIEHVESFDFAANKEEHAADGRARLYARFAKKLAAQLGWSLQQSSTGNDSTEFFSLINPKATPRPEGYFDAIDDGKLGPNGEIPAEYNENIRENISVTGTARGKSARKKNLRPGSEEWFKHWFSLPLMKRESFEEAKKELQDHLTNLIEATIMDSEVIAEEAIDVTGIITPAIKKLDSVFKQNKYEMRIVGGAVRDIVLGKSPKDIDMASDATPDEMIAMLDKAGIKHIPTGIAHGTLTAVVDGEDFEITTLRADSNTDGRHADVSFVRSWEEDAKRRDLTYNAMSMDIAGEIYDYHGGMDDLQDKVSRFVGDPAERMQEDYLRILRYFRFQARMDSPAWDKDTLTAVADNAAGLKKISAERVWMEMEKILGGSNVANVLQSIDKTGVAGVIGLKVENLNLVTDNTDPIIQLAKIGNQPEIAKRWKMDNVRANMLEFLVTHKDHTLDKKAIEDMIADGVDKDKIVALATLQGKSDMAGHVAKASVPEFPVTGKDLIATGMKPGIELGKRLAQLKAKWKDSNFTATKGDLLGESLSEALGEIGENSEIFVDMDGVLADFFGEWTKSQGVDDWKEIKNPEQAIGDIKNIDDFWLNLPVLPKARNLLELIKQVKGKYKICTSPLADDPRSEPHKREWVKKNLAFFPPEEVIVTHNKPQFAKQKDGTSNILIDDFGKNIDAWEAAGGIGFKYKDYKFQRTAKDIKQHMQEPVEENFKDGKVKGKSRPGRVKRSGASCDGSVTELRKKAKNASGDKAKMYHWCANMKSGKK